MQQGVQVKVGNVAACMRRSVRIEPTLPLGCPSRTIARCQARSREPSSCTWQVKSRTQHNIVEKPTNGTVAPVGQPATQNTGRPRLCWPCRSSGIAHAAGQRRTVKAEPWHPPPFTFSPLPSVLQFPSLCRGWPPGRRDTHSRPLHREGGFVTASSRLRHASLVIAVVAGDISTPAAATW